MSRSIHITKKNFKGLSKKELDEQANDPNSELKQWGRKKIQKGLKEKRVSDEIAQKALEQINEKEYRAILNRLAKERYASLKHEQYLVRKKKTMDYLMQKGYEVDLITDTINNF